MSSLLDKCNKLGLKMTEQKKGNSSGVSRFKGPP